MIFVSVNVHVSVVEHQHEIETKNKILDPCVGYDLTAGGDHCAAPASGDSADNVCNTYTCVNTNGTPSCSAVITTANNGVFCDDGDNSNAPDQDVCDAGICVGKKNIYCI